MKILVITSNNDFAGDVIALFPHHTVIVEDGMYAADTFTHNRGPITIVDGNSVTCSDYLRLLSITENTKNIFFVIAPETPIGSAHTMTQTVGATLVKRNDLARLASVIQA